MNTNSAANHSVQTNLEPDVLRVLIVEDAPADAELMVLHLEKEGLKVDWTRVETEAAYRAALETPFDLVLSDWSLPQFSGLAALKLMQKHGLDMTFIIVSGGIGEETAVAVMRQGASDYLLKDRMDRLGQAVINALDQKHLKVENKNAQEALKASEAELRALFASMQDLVLVLDREGVLLRIAPTKPGELFNRANEMLGSSLTQVIPTSQRQEFLQSIQEAINGQTTINYEFSMMSQGTQTWFEVSTSFLSDHEVLCVAHNITERKRTHAQIQLQATALESAGNGIVITDSNGKIEWVNPAFRTLTGYTFAEVQGKYPHELFTSGQQKPAFYTTLWDTVQNGRVWRGELINRRKDGTRYTEEQTITPMLDSSGQITHFIGIKQDISERKQSEAALLRYAHRQEKIAELGRDLTAELMVDVIFQTADDYIQLMIDVNTIGFSLFDSQQGTLKAVYRNCNGVKLDTTSIPTLTADIQHFSSGHSEAIASKQPVLLANLEAVKTIEESMLVCCEKETKSAFIIPMLSEGKVIGLMELQSHQEGAYTPADGDWLSVIANQIGMSIQNANLFSETKQRLIELSAVATINSAVINRFESRNLYAIILEQFQACLGVDSVVLFLLQPEVQMLKCVSEIGFRYDSMLQNKLRVGESLAGKVALDRKILHVDLTVPDNTYPIIFRFPREEFQEFYAVPLVVDTKLIGVLEVLHRSQIDADENWLRSLEILANQAAIAINTNQLNENIFTSHNELLKAYDATITGWSRAMDLRDKETENHTLRVMEITLRMARLLKVDSAQLVHIKRGALLHDIGKLGVPDGILLKPGSLTDEEWVIMRSHPQLAYDMLSSIDYLRPAIDIPYCHHEKWDGTGYPRGLKGEEIPFAARLFSLADVYDALTSDRPYRSRWSHEKALQYIQEQSGKYFDPNLIEPFFSIIAHLPEQVDELPKLLPPD